MSVERQCPACFMGDHDRHNHDWGIRPGLIGGSFCGCLGECAAPDLAAALLAFDAAKVRRMDEHS